MQKLGYLLLSNQHLERAFELGISMDWVQIEMHSQFFDEELIAFCHEKEIGVLAWTPLGRPPLEEDPLVPELAVQHNVAPELIALRWVLQHRCVPLLPSDSDLKIKSYLKIPFN